MKAKRPGFSMVEVLVVIAMISVLALMLFPVFGRVQARGREVRCASNLRQLHTATMSFISNSGGVLPSSASTKVHSRSHQDAPWGNVRYTTGWVASHPAGTDGMKSYWWEHGGSNGTFCVRNGTLFPYLGDAGDESVYICPSMQIEARRTFSGEKARVTRSYGMNNRVSGGRYQDIDGVSRIILFADQGFGAMVSGYQYLALAEQASHSDLSPPVTVPGLTFYQRFFRGIDGSIDYRRESVHKADTREVIGEYHGNRPGRNTGTANVIFLDGHVERVSYLYTTNVCLGAWEYGRPVP